MSRTQPNARLVSAGDKLTRYTSVQVTAAVEVLRDRIRHAHEGGGGGERVHTSDMPNPTEAAGLSRYALTAELEELRDMITDACSCLDLLAQKAERIQRWCDPGDKPGEQALCKQGQHGKEGALEWGDPLCDRLPTKGGMCGAHYMRWWRHRVDHGIDTSRDFAA